MKRAALHEGLQRMRFESLLDRHRGRENTREGGDGDAGGQRTAMLISMIVSVAVVCFIVHRTGSLIKRVA
jgi:hypothetical protein